VFAAGLMQALNRKSSSLNIGSLVATQTFFESGNYINRRRCCCKCLMVPRHSCGNGKEMEMATTDKPSGNEPAQAARDRTADAEKGQAATGQSRQDMTDRPTAESDMARSGGMRGTMRNAVSATEDVSSGVVGGVGNIAGGVIGIVRDTANTAIDGVGSVGENAIHTVADLLAEIVGGVRQVAGAAVSGMRSNGRGGRDQDSLRGTESSRRDQAATHETAAERAMH
jgi:hypothetical protein